MNQLVLIVYFCFQPALLLVSATLFCLGSSVYINSSEVVETIATSLHESI